MADLGDQKGIGPEGRKERGGLRGGGDFWEWFSNIWCCSCDVVGGRESALRRIVAGRLVRGRK